MSIRSANQYPVSQLFNADNKMVFEIPKYQRAYAWGKGQWENLFDDLLDNDPGYYLGTIICIDTSNDSINAPKREVVDGQQRLTTLSLLLCALYSSIAQYEKLLSEDQKLDFGSLKRKLASRNAESCIRIKPQSQNQNLDDYKGVLAEQGIIPAFPLPKNAGKRRIKKAFEDFKERIKKSVIEKSQDIVSELFEFLDKVNSAVMVLIEVSNHSSAYTLFESLNNRGTPLTAIDLIKNLLLAKLDKAGSGSIEYYFMRWQTILESIGDDNAVQERFFRHNYNAFRRSLNKPFDPTDMRPFPLGYLATRSNLLKIYERIITKDPHYFLDELTRNAELYSKIIVRDEEVISSDLKVAYQSLLRAQGTPSYLLLLYLERMKGELEITEQDIAGITQFLISFFVRRNLTDTPPTRDLTRMFMSIIDSIEYTNSKGQEIFNVLRDELMRNLASEAMFEEKLRGPIYEENKDIARFILCKYAESGMTRETKVDLWQRGGKDAYIWTIEHIFPEGENIPDAWVAMIASGDKQKATEIQNQCVHTIGNLTITGYNSTLSNRPFVCKREHTDTNNNFIGYKNGLNLNAYIALQDDWTADKIAARTDSLVGKIMQMFKL